MKVTGSTLARALFLTLDPVISLPFGCNFIRSGETDLEVRLNARFEDDQVEIRLDVEAVFDARAKTNYVISLAKIVELSGHVERIGSALR